MKVGLLNIGNTNSQICSYGFSNIEVVGTDKLLVESAPLLSGYTDIYTASVVPAIYESLVKRHQNINFHELTLNEIKSINFSKVDASSLGADRMANLLGAKSLTKEIVLVVDCGTCVTAELMFDEDFLGGLIMPGRALQRKALNLFADQLPEVPLIEHDCTLGKNTEESMMVGVDTISLNGLHAWIKEMIDVYHDLSICFTGGDCRFYTQNATFKYSVNSILTLHGLRVFADGKC